MTEQYKCPKCLNEILIVIGGLLVCQECDFELAEAMVEEEANG